MPTRSHHTKPTHASSRIPSRDAQAERALLCRQHQRVYQRQFGSTANIAFDLWGRRRRIETAVHGAELDCRPTFRDPRARTAETWWRSADCRQCAALRVHQVRFHLGDSRSEDRASSRPSKTGGLYPSGRASRVASFWSSVEGRGAPVLVPVRCFGASLHLPRTFQL